MAAASIIVAPVLTAGPVRADSSTASSAAATPAAPTWSTLAPPAAPPALHDATEAYDADNKTVVLFGGVRSDGTLSGATWVWDGTTWTQAPLSGPPARSQASMAYDSALHQLILFGGLAADGSQLGDTWAWNGASWVQLVATAAPSSLPEARSGGSLSMDTGGNLVLFGGTGALAGVGGGSPPPLTTLSDTWVWDGRAWSQPSATVSPPARTGASLTWDPTLSTTVLFGGAATPVGTTPPTLMSDTWTWSGSVWTAVVPTAGLPARAGALSAFAGPLGGELVATGSTAAGNADDSWTFDGTTWTPLPAATPPSSRVGAAAAWDDSTQQLVVFGGTDASGNALSDTVVLTANAPVVTSPTTIPTKSGGAGGGSPVTESPPNSTGKSATTTPPTTADHTSTTVAGHSPTDPTSVATAPATRDAPPANRGSSPATMIPVRVPLALPTPPAAVQTVHAGSLVTLLGTGFRPDAVITITFHSTPYTVGRVTANGQGSFSATVAVPTGASLGSHHLEAAGLNPKGKLTTLVTPLRVIALVVPSTSGSQNLTTLTMVAIAILIPVATWAILALRGRRRTPLAAG